MKNTLISLGLALGLAFSAKAAVSSVSLAQTTVTNVPTVLGPTGTNGAAFTLLSATLTSPNNSSASFYLYDAPALTTWYTNSPYSNIISYVTNYIAMWTNYYGATNYWTNASLIDITNTVAGFSNQFPVMYVLTAPTNTTVQFLNLNTRFSRGCLVTNTAGNAQSAGSILSLTYTQ